MLPPGLHHVTTSWSKVQGHTGTWCMQLKCAITQCPVVVSTSFSMANIRTTPETKKRKTVAMVTPQILQFISSYFRNAKVCEVQNRRMAYIQHKFLVTWLKFEVKNSKVKVTRVHSLSSTSPKQNKYIWIPVLHSVLHFSFRICQSCVKHNRPLPYRSLFKHYTIFWRLCAYILWDFSKCINFELGFHILERP